MPFVTNLSWYQQGEPASGSPVALEPHGVLNRPLAELLGNCQYLKEQVVQKTVEQSQSPVLWTWAPGFNIEYPVTVAHSGMAWILNTIGQEGSEPGVDPYWDGPYDYLKTKTLATETDPTKYGLIEFATPAEAQTNILDKALSSLTVSAGTNKVLTFDAAGDATGTATGDLFNDIQAAINAVPAGGTGTITLAQDLDLDAVGSLEIKNKHIILVTDDGSPDYTLSPTRRIFRSDPSTATIHVVAGTLEIRCLDLEYGSGTATDPRKQPLICLESSKLLLTIPEPDLSGYLAGTTPVTIGNRVETTAGTSSFLSVVGHCSFWSISPQTVGAVTPMVDLYGTLIYMEEGTVSHSTWSSVPTTGINI